MQRLRPSQRTATVEAVDVAAGPTPSDGMTRSTAQGLPRLISVIIITRNRAVLLRQAIESVLRQEPCGAPVELIVVDDSSTDDTSAVVASYPAARYVHTRQGTCGGSRNVGVEHARGDWIAFLDDDDVWLPARLKRCCDVIKARPTVTLVGSAAIICDYDLRHRSLWKGPDLQRTNAYHAFFEELFAPSTVFMHRSIFEKVGRFQTHTRADDRDMWLRAALNGFECASVPEPLVLYRLGVSTGRWREQGDRQIRGDYVDTMAVLRRYLARRDGRRPHWWRRQRILWRARGWYSHLCMTAAREADEAGDRTMAWRLRRTAIAMSPLHAVRNWVRTC
jgi:glycosyltransferase involved in cell wall biosynthesis